jgi:hypothetical protein
MYIRVNNLAIVLASKDNTMATFVWTKSTSSLWNLNGYLLLVYIDNIYGLHLKGQTQILSQNRSPNSFYMYIRVNNLAIVLASKDNTMAKYRIYLRRNSE